MTWVIVGIVPSLSRENDGERRGDNERRGGGRGSVARATRRTRRDGEMSSDMCNLANRAVAEQGGDGDQGGTARGGTTCTIVRVMPLLSRDSEGEGKRGAGVCVH